jgi:hypothetical protein
MPRLEKNWMPSCAMKRVICHWSVGRPQANDIDKEHYHLLVEGDGKVIRGRHSIDDNVSTKDGDYAAHTHGCNTGSIGVALCGMMGCKESPFTPGSFPITEKQWDVMIEVVAELCQFYRIPVTPETVMGHGEVQVNLGIKQKGKWDPLVLPWDPTLSRSQVGRFLRTRVKNCIECGPDQMDEEKPIGIHAVIRGTAIDEAVLTNESSYVFVRAAAAAIGWTIEYADGDEAVLAKDDVKHKLPLVLVQKRGYVSCRDLAEVLGAEIAWNSKTKTVTVG